MNASNSNGVAVQRSNGARDPREIIALLEHDRARETIEPFLPPGTDLKRVVAEAYLAAKNSEAIMQCTGESIVLSVARIQSWGLTIGETAHLVPFGRVCTPIADYKGLAQLMIASGAVRAVEPRCVYEHDEFKYEQGLTPQLRHVPLHRDSDRGQLIGAYCILRLPFGVSTFEFFSIEFIDRIRQKYSKQWKTGPCPPWYAMKTAIRQMAKLIPKDPRLAAALRVIQEDALEEGLQLAVDEDAAPAIAAPAVAESPAPTSAPAPNADEQEIARAMALPLRGSPDKWGGHGGKPIGQLDSKLLEAAQAFFQKKLREAPGDRALVEQVECIGVVLAERAKDQLELAGDDDDAPTEASPASTDPRVSVPPPGRVADALTPTERASVAVDANGLPF